MSSSYGQRFKITLFGESHGQCVGCVIDGIPAGMQLDFEAIGRRLEARRPGHHAGTSARRETDAFEILSGVYKGTGGAPLCVRFPNADVHSADYAAIVNDKHFRPGHADYTAYVKHGGHSDLRGGGHFSARLTAPIVFAGSIAEQWLAQYGIQVFARVLQVGRVCRAKEALEAFEAAPTEEMLAVVESARAAGNSVGGAVQAMVTGLPAGLGNPFFDTMEGRLSYGLFAIPGVKGVGFGAGFAYVEQYGSDAVDAYMQVEGGAIQTVANSNGGILGGMTTGMPLMVDCAFKPTASLSMPVETLHFESGLQAPLQTKGRHDPCIALRAVPVVRAMVAVTLMDIILGDGDHWNRVVSAASAGSAVSAAGQKAGGHVE